MCGRQYVHGTTWRHPKQLVKEDAMLDSLDAREHNYDNSANGINFTIRKVNLMFVFIVVVWIFFFNKYMIQNPVFFLCIMLLCSLCFTRPKLTPREKAND